MVGFPKFLNTKNDYEYIRKNFPDEEWEPVYQNLLDTMYAWFNVGVILDDGITGDSHKVVIDEQNNKRYQYEKRIDENCKLLKIGYTEEEVKAIIERK